MGLLENTALIHTVLSEAVKMTIPPIVTAYIEELEKLQPRVMCSRSQDYDA